MANRAIAAVAAALGDCALALTPISAATRAATITIALILEISYSSVCLRTECLIATQLADRELTLSTTS